MERTSGTDCWEEDIPARCMPSDTAVDCHQEADPLPRYTPEAAGPKDDLEEVDLKKDTDLLFSTFGLKSMAGVASATWSSLQSYDYFCGGNRRRGQRR